MSKVQKFIVLRELANDTDKIESQASLNKSGTATKTTKMRGVICPSITKHLNPVLALELRHEISVAYGGDACSSVGVRIKYQRIRIRLGTPFPGKTPERDEVTLRHWLGGPRTRMEKRRSNLTIFRDLFRLILVKPDNGQIRIFIFRN